MTPPGRDGTINSARKHKEAVALPWYWIALLVCLVIGPFDALYVYIKSQKRRDELKRRREEQEKTNKSQTEDDRG